MNSREHGILLAGQEHSLREALFVARNVGSANAIAKQIRAMLASVINDQRATKMDETIKKYEVSGQQSALDEVRKFLETKTKYHFEQARAYGSGSNYTYHRSRACCYIQIEDAINTLFE